MFGQTQEGGGAMSIQPSGVGAPGLARACARQARSRPSSSDRPSAGIWPGRGRSEGHAKRGWVAEGPSLFMQASDAGRHEDEGAKKGYTN